MKDQHDKKSMTHLVCGYCGVLLDCDWMGIALDYDDPCPETKQNYHRPKLVDCDCEQKVTING